ncbi:MAG: hypothetical protein COU90_04425 [Candidatus Ryanbacteria bacterium CG10_big_fil_rev_8_21_14_0_10_43_42]|uniref:Uncharacterized protein n=1 Tax=Candidatus Ryanbacteria bacterium CG10_big_fil_rev_8_21_14_0_10_43_42 TaxID=1974864 RepID=A0A2M8KVY7_9BACT|nr:MAG: hypothetical protein COU90_04425 [Candidatus Ryanbacteria bacterium CG10_big_fil_rev_8_21_14_0_10_43_42]
MPNISKPRTDTIESVTLSAKERREMRAGLAHFLNTYAAHTYRFGWHAFFMFFRSFYGALGTAMGMVLIAGGISYAAESSLPGDVLYPIKVGGTERVRSWTAISYEANGAWNVTRADRRLQEAALLAVQGKLDSEKEADLTSRLQKHTEEATETIAHLQIEKQITAAANTSSRLESSLRLRGQILTQITEDRMDISGPMKGMLAVIKKDVTETTKVRTSLEEEIAEDVSDEGDIQKEEVEKKAKELKGALVAAWKHVKADSFHDALRRKAETFLVTAKDLADAGDAFLLAGEYGKAFTSYQKALRIAHAVSTFSEAKTDFAIDLNLEALIGEEDVIVADAVKPEKKEEKSTGTEK